MDWEALGAIGEMVGAIAVVATLGYLAIQLRLNTKSVYANTHQQILNAQQPLWLARMDFVNAKILLEAIAQDELEPHEALAAGSHAVMSCRAHQNIFNQVMSGSISADAANLDRLGRNVAFNPVVDRFWGDDAPEVWEGARLQDFLSPAYLSYLSGLRQAGRRT